MKAFASPAFRFGGVLRHPFFHILVIVVLGFIVYGATLNAPFVFDDHVDILGNPNIRSFRHIFIPADAVFFGSEEYLKFYHSRIVGFASFALNYAVHGYDVAGYHVVNILIHVMNGIALYWLVRLTTAMPYFSSRRVCGGISVAVACLAAVLFVVHPVQTQAVTYIKQRFTSLATFFYIGALVLYVRSSIVDKGARWAYGGAMLAGLLAMRTKEIAFTLPVGIFMLEFFFGDGAWRKRILRVAPFGALMLVIPLTLAGYDAAGGVSRVQTDISRMDYLYTQIRVIVTYLRLLVLPVNQNLDYDYPLFTSFFNVQVVLSFLLHSVLLLSAAYLWRRSEKGEPLLRFAAFGICWFYVTLAVESSVLPIVDLINEHRVYLPSAGFIIAAVAVVVQLRERIAHGAVGRPLIAAVCAVAIFALAAAAVVRNRTWLDETTLWEDVVEKSPQNARGHRMLGSLYFRKNPPVALAHYNRALALAPSDPSGLFGLAMLLIDTGEREGGTRLLEKIVAGREHPTTRSGAIGFHAANAALLLGNICFEDGDWDRAAAWYEIAVRYPYEPAKAYYNLGLISEKTGRRDRAVWYYRKAREEDRADFHGLGERISKKLDALNVR